MVTSDESEIYNTKWWQCLNGFDMFVILGGIINLFVVVLLIGYWFLKS
jgi:hypothetical protein